MCNKKWKKRTNRGQENWLNLGQERPFLGQTSKKPGSLTFSDAHINPVYKPCRITAYVVVWFRQQPGVPDSNLAWLCIRMYSAFTQCIYDRRIRRHAFGYLKLCAGSIVDYCGKLWFYTHKSRVVCNKDVTPKIKLFRGRKKLSSLFNFGIMIMIFRM